jgi:hypothetical protein
MAGMAVEHSYTSDIRGDLPLIQHADLEGKIVLVRVDHNVVSKGESFPNCVCSRLQGSVELESLTALTASVVCHRGHQKRWVDSTCKLM